MAYRSPALPIIAPETISLTIAPPSSTGRPPSGRSVLPAKFGSAPAPRRARGGAPPATDRLPRRRELPRSARTGPPPPARGSRQPPRSSRSVCPGRGMWPASRVANSEPEDNEPEVITRRESRAGRAGPTPVPSARGPERARGARHSRSAPGPRRITSRHARRAPAGPGCTATRATVSKSAATRRSNAPSAPASSRHRRAHRSQASRGGTRRRLRCGQVAPPPQPTSLGEIARIAVTRASSASE